MKRANPAAVGAFVLGSLALAVGGLLFFGGGRLFADVDRYAIYFDGSVNGLQVGSPVKLEGVEIGQVKAIRAIADAAHGNVYTETVVEIDRSRFERRGPWIPDPHQRAKALVERGIRARLELQSLITGQLYVAVLLLPGTPPRLVAPPDAPYPEIPAVPSTSQEVQRVVRSAVEKFEALPIQDIAAKLDAILAGVDRLLNEAKLDEAVANLSSTLVEAQGAIGEARRVLRGVDAQLGPVSESAIATLDEARSALQGARSTVNPDSPLAYQLSAALEELADAAKAMRELAVYLERNPSSLVFGRSSDGR